ncbi:serine acetyltransferase [Chryseolinea sp. T2]|uniref:serine O-acetyltransferase n=1 Tax=Chryseolinea sp. T2 TaxID=3129255 RepID=UPI0030780573
MKVIIHKIKKDLFRYKAGAGLGAFVKAFLSIPGFRLIFTKRICEHTSALNPIGIVARLMYKCTSIRFGLQIPHRVRIAPGLYIGHYGNIVVNMGVQIGKNCNIAQGVTIGSTSRGKKKGTPVIGDRVWIGANSVIVGNITIGNDALIAPLSFVNFDVPPHALVMGNPAKVINMSGSEGYVNNILD